MGMPGSPEGDVFAKGALEGLAMQNPTQAGGLLDPYALLWTDKALLGLNDSQVEMFQKMVAGHNDFLQRQYGTGYVLGATTMGLSMVVPAAAAADAAIDADVVMMVRANELSNAEANSGLASTAGTFPREAPVPGLGRAFRAGNASYPPSPGATRGMNGLGGAAADSSVDCDELAEHRFSRSGIR
jgi:hypothetical protein